MQIIFLSSILVLAFTAIDGRTEDQGAVTNGAPCEVCVNVINAVKDLHATNKFKTHEEALLHHCNKVVKTGSKEDKVCYNLTPVQKDVGRQLSYRKETGKICKTLSKTNNDVCATRYDVKVSEDTDLSKLRVRQLKGILSGRGVDCVGCVEKDDFIKKIKETQHMEL
ncbi:hypothetical protein ABG067_001109 [Albugo candida]